MYKIIYLFSLLLWNINTVINAINISHNTIYTRYTLESNKLNIKCNSDNECPLGYQCSIEEKRCYFENFLCPEDVNENCLYINKTIWDIYNEKIKPEYANKQKYLPIINVCNKNHVEKGKCKTEKCQKNEDCFSGECYLNTCITKSPIYICSNSDIRKSNGVYCGKIANTKCRKDEECFSNYCNDEGFCEVHKIEL